MKIAVLVSGSGSNLQALINANLSAEIVGVISNKSNAYALQRAQQHHIPTCVISHTDYTSRACFDEAVHQQLLNWRVDLVILAGFMRILTPMFVKQWEGKMLNIHPSLLPAYKGVNTHQRVLNTGDQLHGCTVHFVTAELDAGTSLVQGVVPVSYQDSVQTLQNKVHALEHFIYPYAIELICTHQIIYQTPNQVLYQNQALRAPIQFFKDKKSAS